MNIKSNPYQATPGGASNGQAVSTSTSQGYTSDAKNLVEGQVFKGEIINIQNSQVTIGLENGTTLQARMEDSVDVYIGQKVSFVVKSNQDNLVEIKPVSLNGQDNPAIARALLAAGITATDKSVALVMNLMQQGMAIDKQTLQSLMRQIVQFPNTDIKTLVTMNRFQIPVTPENVEQFQNYQSAEHRIFQSIQALSESLPNLLGEWSETADSGEISKIQARLIELFLNGTHSSSNSELTSATGVSQLRTDASNAGISNVFDGIGKNTLIESGQSQEVLETTEATALRSNLQESLLSQQSQLSQQSTLLGGQNGMETISLLSNNNTDQTSQPINESIQNSITSRLQGLQDPEVVAPELQNVNSFSYLETGSSVSTLDQILSEPERQLLGSQLKAVGATEDLVQKVLEGQVSVKGLLSLVKETLAESSASDVAMRNLFGGKEYGKLLQVMLKEHWMIQPSELTVANKIQDYYEEVNQQAHGMRELLMDMGQQSSNSFKQASTMQNNIEFMNQLNETFTFFQMPLKFSEQEAHSDLYVFMNKKNQVEKKDSYSVLLHLDMESLGQTDVYITLEQNTVRAKFTLADDTSIIIVEENLQQLINKLTDKGYHVQATVEPKEKEFSFVEDFLEQDQAKVPMKRYAFDVRM